MYSEKVGCSKNRGLITTIILLLLLGFCITFNILKQFFIPIVSDILAVLVFSCAVYFIMRYLIYEYSYSVDESEIVFKKLAGERETILIKGNLKLAVCLAKANDKALMPYKKGTTINCCTLSDREKYCIVFKDSDKTTNVIFQPSEKLLELLNTRINL